MKKKIMVLVMATLMLFAFSTTALAAEKENIDDKYDLKTISAEDLPDGIKPIEFDTIEEANAFLSNIKAESDSNNAIALQQKKEAITSQLSDDKANSTRATYYDGVQTKTIPGTNNFLNKGVGVVRYKYTNTSIGKRFSSCTSFSADYEGFTAFLDYTLMSYSSSILDSSRTLGISFTGKTDYYLLIEGLIKYYSRIDTSWVEYSYTKI